MSWTPITCFFKLVGLENDLLQILQQTFFDAISGRPFGRLIGLRRISETFKHFVKLKEDAGLLDWFSRVWLLNLVIFVWMVSGEISWLISLVFDKNENLLCLRDKIKAKIDKSCKQRRNFWRLRQWMCWDILKMNLRDENWWGTGDGKPSKA